MKPSSREILFGCDEPPAPELVLQAGPLNILLRGTRLLYLRIGQVEVWHGVSFVFRDADWGTLEPVVEHVEHQASTGGFRVKLLACVPSHPPLSLQVFIEGQADGSVYYRATCTAQGELATNRTGLYVMHPQEAAGCAVTVTHDDGRQSHSTFPHEIAPWPPFMSVRAIAHEWAPGRWAECRFEGDVFELEDQRNNADASFKTYNRSNMMPRPYLLRAGQVVSQSVRLKLLEEREASQHPPIRQQPSTRPNALLQHSGIGSSIGIGIEASDCTATEAVLERLRLLKPAHLHLHLASVSANVDWNGLARLLHAAQATLRLDVSLNAPDEPVALALLANTMQTAKIQAESVAVFPSTPPHINAARRAFRNCKIGGGTPHFFTQLNRAEDLGELDFLSFTTSAIVHDTDNDVIMDGLRSLPFMVETLAKRYLGVPVRVGPSAIAARASPLGAQPASDGSRRVALAKRDPRTRGLYGAAWLLGYVAQLSGMKVQTLTLMQLQGDDGLLPVKGAVPVPAFFVFQALQGAQEVTPLLGLPTGVCGVRVRSASHSHTLIANLQNKLVMVNIGLISPRASQVCVMNEASLHAARVNLPDPSQHASANEAEATEQHQASAWQPISYEASNHGDGDDVELTPYAVLRVRT